jgi:transposase-like protein
MSNEMDEEIKRWTARRKSALVLEIIQGKTTVSESSRQFDLSPSEIESCLDQAKAGMENAPSPSVVPGASRITSVMLRDTGRSAMSSRENTVEVSDDNRGARRSVAHDTAHRRLRE